MEKFVVVFDSHSQGVKFENKQEMKYTDNNVSIGFELFEMEGGESRRWAENDGLVCLVLGYITNADEVKSIYGLRSHTMAELMIDLYMKNGTNSLYDVEGLYLVVLYDKVNRKMHVVPSYLGYYLPVYYAVVDGVIFVSSSLKDLLALSKIKRALNMLSVGKMIYHRTMIPGSNTLVEGVYKLLPTTLIELSLGFSDLKIVRYPGGYRKKVDKKFAEKNLLSSIESQVEMLYHAVNGKKVATTLTAGFDTNILLYYLKKFQEGVVDVYSIDGGGKNSEVDIVHELLKKYTKLNSTIENISHEVVGEFPDIVWNVEGYIFDEGLFLRHVLSTCLQKNSVDAVYLGSAADQVMMQIDKYLRWVIRPLRKMYYYMSNKEWEEEMIRGSFLRKCRGDLMKIYRYGMLIDCNLKLHGLLMNSSGIMPLYPFVNRQTYSMSKAIGLKNKGKKYYKGKVRDELKGTIGNDLIEKIQKSGNVIDVKKYYMENKDVLNRVLKKELSKDILGEKNVEKITRCPEKYSSLILQLVYIYLFKELIVSGKYDHLFNRCSVTMKLDALLLN